MTLLSSPAHALPRPPRRLRLHAAALALGALIAWAAPAPAAHAQDDAPGPGAFELMNKGTAYAQKRRYTEALDTYRDALRAGPNEVPDVYYNMGEILRIRNKCNKAAIYYKRFLELRPDVSDRPQIEKHIRGCEAGLVRPGKVELVVANPDLEDLVVSIDGVPVSTNASSSYTLSAGRYNVQVRAKDRHTFNGDIEVLANDTKQLSVDLKTMTFFGNLKLDVNVEGATVSVDGAQVGTTPLGAPLKVNAGKRFLELNKDGYHRWIRNVNVGRDETLTVDITMQRAKK